MLVPETAKTSPKHSKIIQAVAKDFSLLILCHTSEEEGCAERQGTSKGRATPEGTAGSSCGCNLSSKLLPRGGELHRGASTRRKAQGAGHRQDISCTVSSLFLPCSEQWPQQETYSCGQSGEWIRAAVSGPEQKLLELQQGEAPHRRCEQGREDPSWEERGKGRVQGPTELPGHWARQASVGQTHRAPRRDGGCTQKQDLHCGLYHSLLEVTEM